METNEFRGLPLERKARRTIDKHGMLHSGDRVLVAVSGGADSTALLLCLNALAQPFSLALVAAHLNHGLRGAESDADEAFARALSLDLGLPFVSEKADVAALAGEGRHNLEDAARRVRYQFLRRTAALHVCRKIAVGHNLSDQAESVLLRFLRGSGPDGLSGIYPVLDDLIIRPLLECSRGEIEDYLAAQERTWREDATNRDMKLRRNRLRHELLPYLARRFNPRIIETLARSAAVTAELADFLGRESGRVFEALAATAEPGSVCLPAARLCELHPAMRALVLRQAIRRCRGSLTGVNSRHVRALESICRRRRSGRSLDLPGGLTACLEFDLLWLRRTVGRPAGAYCHILPVPGRCEATEAGLEFRAYFGACPAIPAAPPDTASRAYLEAARLPASLLVRSRLPGDRYGGSGHRKVKRLLINARIPLMKRALQPMVVSGEAVVWIPGFAPARPFRAQKGAPRCVVVEVLGSLRP